MKAVMPQPEAIARAAAESSGSEIGVHGAVALQLLGLSTQMPMQPVFLTNGPSRKILFIAARTVSVLLSISTSLQMSHLVIASRYFGRR
jgi:hypothetical protein